MKVDLIMIVDFGCIFGQQKVGLVQISIAKSIALFFLIIDNNPAPEPIRFLRCWSYTEPCTLIMSTS